MPTELQRALTEGLQKIPDNIKKNWDQWVAEQTGYQTIEQMYRWLSAEQIDAAGMAIFNFSRNKPLILADETGLGKGRALAAICRYMVKQHKKTVFITERRHLYSDFWRDIEDTDNKTIIGLPIIYDPQGELYDQQGNLLSKLTTSKFNKLLVQGKADENILFCTYSQMSTSGAKKNRLGFLKKYLQGGLLILDECHNASGDSNTRDFVESLKECAQHVVYSSATFAKTIEEMTFYHEAIGLPRDTMDMLINLLSNNDEKTLRQYLTYDLATQLILLRREHEPVKAEWQWHHTESAADNMDKFGTLIRNIFKMVNLMLNETGVEESGLKNAWYSLGGKVARMGRNVLLASKLDTLIQTATELHQQNKKPVVVMDSTFAALSDRAIEANDNEEIEGDGIDFRDFLKEFFKKSVEEYYRTDMENPEIHHLKQEIYQAIENFPPLSPSPIDSIIQGLERAGIRTSEISGRSTFMQQNETGKWDKHKRTVLPRILTVKNFNSGETDAVVLTRAGASGISLHAGNNFIDKKVRALIELEITNRPTYRLQFIGRVRRKNQFCEPEFHAVVSRLAFEARILSGEQAKMRQMKEHLSGESVGIQENIIDLHSPQSDNLAYQWLISHTHLAFMMGISLKGKKEAGYYVDFLLKRSVILESAIQDKLYAYLTEGVKCAQMVQDSLFNPPIQCQISKPESLWYRLKENEKINFATEVKKQGNYSLFLNQMRYQWVGQSQSHLTYATQRVMIPTLQQQLKQGANLDGLAQATGACKMYYATLLRQGYIAKPDILNSAMRNMLTMKFGQHLKVVLPQGNLFGYLESIELPEASNQKHPSHYLANIRTIDPHKNQHSLPLPSLVKLSFADLIEGELEIYSNTEPDWYQFERTNNPAQRQQTILVGHPIWMHFLHASWQDGISQFIEHQGKRMVTVVLPQYTTKEKLIQRGVPLYNAQDAMNALIDGGAKELSSDYHDFSKGLIHIFRTTGGYRLLISFKLSQNPQFMDYPLRQKLGTYNTTKTHEVFFIPYKEIRAMISMIIKRGIILFKKPV